MGIPFSKQISFALDQVQPAVDQIRPLVAAGFEVLKTTKNIAILLAVLQVYISVILTLSLCALLALLITVNPDLEGERTMIITPVVQWLADWIHKYWRLTFWWMKVVLVLGIAVMGLLVLEGAKRENSVSGGGDYAGAGEEVDVDAAQAN